MKWFLIQLIILLLIAPGAVNPKAPEIDPANDFKHLGPVEKFLFWTSEQQVASYRNIDKIFPTRIIRAGKQPLELPEQKVNLNGVKVFAVGMFLTIDEFFSQRNVAGLLVIKDGKIAYERYGLGNSKESLWISFSVAKSVTSMLVGAAIKDGYIESVDEKVTDYLPRLKNSPYDQATIRNLMQMSSGVQ